MTTTAHELAKLGASEALDHAKDSQLDQDWDAETTKCTFSDGSVLYVHGSTVHAASSDVSDSKTYTIRDVRDLIINRERTAVLTDMGQGCGLTELLLPNHDEESFLNFEVVHVLPWENPDAWVAAGRALVAYNLDGMEYVFVQRTNDNYKLVVVG